MVMILQNVAVQIIRIGMDKIVLHVVQENYGIKLLTFVNALILLFGMDLIVNDLISANQGKFGIRTCIIVPVHNIFIGMVNNVKRFLSVREVRF